MSTPSITKRLLRQSLSSWVLLTLTLVILLSMTATAFAKDTPKIKQSDDIWETDYNQIGDLERVSITDKKVMYYDGSGLTLIQEIKNKLNKNKVVNGHPLLTDCGLTICTYKIEFTPSKRMKLKEKDFIPKWEYGNASASTPYIIEEQTEYIETPIFQTRLNDTLLENGTQNNFTYSYVVGYYNKTKTKSVKTPIDKYVAAENEPITIYIDFHKKPSESVAIYHEAFGYDEKQAGWWNTSCLNMSTLSVSWSSGGISSTLPYAPIIVNISGANYSDFLNHSNYGNVRFTMNNETELPYAYRGNNSNHLIYHVGVYNITNTSEIEIYLCPQNYADNSNLTEVMSKNYTDYWSFDEPSGNFMSSGTNGIQFAGGGQQTGAECWLGGCSNTTSFKIGNDSDTFYDSGNDKVGGCYYNPNYGVGANDEILLSVRDKSDSGDRWVNFRSGSNSNVSYYNGAVKTFIVMPTAGTNIIHSTIGSTTNLYLDGVLSNTASAGVGSTGHYVMIGSNYGSTPYDNYFEGTVDECWLTQSSDLSWITDDYISALYTLQMRDGAVINYTTPASGWQYDYSYTNGTDTQTQTQYFWVNSTNATAKVYINGTEKSLTSTNDSTWTNFTLSFNPSAISSTQDYEVFWNVSPYGNGVNEVNDTYTLRITPVGFLACGGITNTSTINYSFYDAETFASINATMSVSFTYTKLGVPFSSALSFNESTNATVCINPADANITASLVETVVSTGYNSKVFYQTSTAYTNSTLQRGVYLLNSSSGRNVVISVKTRTLLPKQNYTVEAYHYIASNNSYLLDASGRTDATGQTVQYLQTAPELYKFRVYDENANLVAEITNPDATLCAGVSTLSTCYYNIILQEVLTGFYTGTDGVFELGELCTFTNATKVLRCAYTESVGSTVFSLQNLTLLVQKQDANNITWQATNMTLTQGANVSIYIPYSTGLFRYAFVGWYSGEQSSAALTATKLLEGGFIDLGSDSSEYEYGQDGWFMTGVLAMVIAFATLSNPSLLILGVGGVIILSTLFGFITLSSALLISLVVIVLVIANYLK